MIYLFNTAQKMTFVRDLSKNLDCSLFDKYFNELSWKDNVNNSVSVEMDFLSHPHFSSHKTYLENECKNFLISNFIKEELFNGLQITNSWGNITKGGESHHEHTHPFSVVSGVIFLDNNEDNLNLDIEGYVAEIPYFIPNNRPYVSLKRLFDEAGVGPESHNNLKYHLVLFLSNFHHKVNSISKDRPPRRSIAFNTFWKGRVGLNNEPLGSYTF